MLKEVEDFHLLCRQRMCSCSGILCQHPTKVDSLPETAVQNDSEESAGVGAD